MHHAYVGAIYQSSSLTEALAPIMRCSIQEDEKTQSNAGLMQSMVSQMHIGASNVTNKTLTDSQPANFYIALSTHKNSKMGQYSISSPPLFFLPSLSQCHPTGKSNYNLVYFPFIIEISKCKCKIGENKQDNFL